MSGQVPEYEIVDSDIFCFVVVEELTPRVSHTAVLCQLIFLTGEFLGFCIYFGCKSFVVSVICSYFLLVCSFPFHSCIIEFPLHCCG